MKRKPSYRQLLTELKKIKEKRSAAARRHYQKHRPRIRLEAKARYVKDKPKRRKYYLQNRMHILAYLKLWRQKISNDPVLAEKRRKYQRAYYRNNRAKCRKLMSEWQKRNRKRINETAKLWRLKHKEQVRAKRKRLYAKLKADPVRYRQHLKRTREYNRVYAKLWRLKNMERFKAIQKRYYYRTKKRPENK